MQASSAYTTNGATLANAISNGKLNIEAHAQRKKGLKRDSISNANLNANFMHDTDIYEMRMSWISESSTG